METIEEKTSTLLGLYPLLKLDCKYRSYGGLLKHVEYSLFYSDDFHGLGAGDVTEFHVDTTRVFYLH